MDGLDIYIDDFSQPDPIPPEILAKLQHAREWLMDDATAQCSRGGDGATAPVDGERGRGPPRNRPLRWSARLRKLRLLRVGDASTICRARCRRSRRKSRDKTHPERQIVARRFRISPSHVAFRGFLRSSRSPRPYEPFCGNRWKNT